VLMARISQRDSKGVNECKDGVSSHTEFHEEPSPLTPRARISTLRSRPTTLSFLASSEKLRRT